MYFKLKDQDEKIWNGPGIETGTPPLITNSSPVEIFQSLSLNSDS